MISFENVSKYFNGVKAVDNISLQIAEGETLVLLGTSGCGKTTTLRMINRLTEPSEGMISVNGENILRQVPEKLRRNIGYVLQHHGLFPHYTVAENVEVTPALLKWDKQKRHQRTRVLLEQLHLPYNDFANLYPANLSGGQQQRVGVARALAADPPVLLMDEPFGALDPVTRVNIRNELIQLEDFKKKTIIMVTHDVEEAFFFGDRICLMNKGRIVQAGTPEELLFHPVNEFVRNFLSQQRLQLEFKTITLRKVWQYLSDKREGRKVGSLLNMENNIWEAMECLTKELQEKNPFAEIINEELRQSKKVDLNDLLRAFGSYKSQMYE